LFAWLSLLAVLVAGIGEAMAIGDSGGCSLDSMYARTLGFGTVAEIESYISANTSRRLEHLDRSQKALLQKNPAQLKAWQDSIKRQMLQEKLSCSLDFPLDYAVANGNLDVVRWLLGLGADPNAASGNSSIFTRCRGSNYGSSDGISKEQARQRQIEAYRILLEHGANINDPDPFHSVYGCLSHESHPMLRQLGARVTAEAFKSQVAGARQAGGGILEYKWTVVQELAKGQAFDFRGTAFEYGLLTMIDARDNMSDFDAVVELTKRLSTIVRLSPGIVPGISASPADVPEKFNPVRERCYFPEISAYPDFEFLALKRDAKPGPLSSGTQDTTEIRVGKTKAPVLLAVFNNRDTPTKWVIRQSKEASVLGVIVLDGYEKKQGSKDTLSFDPLRPAFLGETHFCNVIVLTNQSGNRRDILKPYWPANPATQTFNPFRLRGEPTLVTSDSDQFVVGEISPSSTLISWPNSLRTKHAAPKN